ncbi:MAG: histidinol dehydrogenase [Peptococcaceae bacterium]|nr:histidinol dehydrogenase [Peptococcaceae bacterium]
MRRDFSVADEVVQAVDEIISIVRADGDRGLCGLTRRFDGASLQPEDLRVTPDEIRTAYRMVDDKFLQALKTARDRIYEFHCRQISRSWLETGDEIITGQMVRPLERVGIYVPGGTAAYPSSVLMNALPAKAAGVKEIVMVTPPARNGTVNPHTLVAASEAGVTEIYRVGGAQAVAALAYGTEHIRKVDKITGPGNIYVTQAKQRVYGQVDIDMLAGPSEVFIIADTSIDPAFAAADMLAQAEHDPMAKAVLATPSWELAAGVRDELRRQLEKLPRQEVLAQSVEKGCLIVVTRDLEEAFGLANRFAPEHLEIMVANPWTWLGRVRNAGAVFLGAHTPVPVGDYAGGPNHVLPTGGTARFFSALGTDAFVKRINVMSCSPRGLLQIRDSIIDLAETEGLAAHAEAVRIRFEGGEKN